MLKGKGVAGSVGEVKEGYNNGLLEMKSLLCVLSRTGQEGIHLFIEKKILCLAIRKIYHLGRVMNTNRKALYP